MTAGAQDHRKVRADGQDAGIAHSPAVGRAEVQGRLCLAGTAGTYGNSNELPKVPYLKLYY